jgi:HSF-type DNA-binding
MGRIVVHDRIKMEATVLPRYFNHSSFASLRRQLNYFSFVRLGKGRQRESTYINDVVVELDDILNLKRRSSVNHVPFSPVAAPADPLLAVSEMQQVDARTCSQHRPSQHDDSMQHDHLGRDKPMDPSMSLVKDYVSIPTTINKKTSTSGKNKIKPQSVKRARLGSKTKAVAAAKPRPTMLKMASHSGPVISEDERSSSSLSSSSWSTMSVNITTSLKHRPAIISLDLACDKELLAGCTALLGLSSGKVWE